MVESGAQGKVQHNKTNVKMNSKDVLAWADVLTLQLMRGWDLRCVGTMQEKATVCRNNGMFVSPGRQQNRIFPQNPANSKLTSNINFGGNKCIGDIGLSPTVLPLFFLNKGEVSGNIYISLFHCNILIIFLIKLNLRQWRLWGGEICVLVGLQFLLAFWLFGWFSFSLSLNE